VLAAIIVGVNSGAVCVAALVVGLAIRLARCGRRRATRQDRRIRWGA